MPRPETGRLALSGEGRVIIGGVIRGGWTPKNLIRDARTFLFEGGFSETLPECQSYAGVLAQFALRVLYYDPKGAPRG